MQPIALLALATGMRRGELLALRWSEVDLDGGVVTVERSVEETGTSLTIKPPKTEAGNRAITIPANAVTMLRAHRAEQMRLRLALGQGGAPVLVFSTIDGKMFFPDDFSKTWQRIVTARKLPKVTFHALRHTHASILLAQGVPVLTVSKRLGHSKASHDFGRVRPRDATCRRCCGRSDRRGSVSEEARPIIAATTRPRRQR